MAWIAGAIAIYFAMPTGAWHDRVHIAVMEVCNAPYSSCVAIAPDILTTKLPKEAANHFTYVNRTKVTIDDVYQQVGLYDKVDSRGHLYGAIIAATRSVQKKLEEGARPDYNYGFMAHYIGDLSQPLHNSPYDSFNKANHNRIDGIVDDLSKLTKRVAAYTTDMRVHSIDDIAAAVASIANCARAADATLRHLQTMSHEEALKLLGKSATLLCAINKYIFVGLRTANGTTLATLA